MAPQVASLSELSRIRGDAEVRYSYTITQPKLSTAGLDREPAVGVRGLYGQGGSEEDGERWKERVWERDIKQKSRDRLQQGDKLLVKWLLLSSRGLSGPVLAPVPVSHKVI